MTWQQANIQAAAAYLRERMAAGATDARTKSIYEGLLEVLDPNRRSLRLRRELTESAQAVPVHSNRERRGSPERRARDDRRMLNLGPLGGVERRAGRDRRTGRDRRAGR
jgi:hypothetical protein